LAMHRFEIKTLQGTVLALLLEHPPKAKWRFSSPLQSSNSNRRKWMYKALLKINRRRQNHKNWKQSSLTTYLMLCDLCPSILLEKNNYWSCSEAEFNTVIHLTWHNTNKTDSNELARLFTVHDTCRSQGNFAQKYHNNQLALKIKIHVLTFSCTLIQVSNSSHMYLVKISKSKGVHM
jgi:hypothetical protein